MIHGGDSIGRFLHYAKLMHTFIALNRSLFFRNGLLGLTFFVYYVRLIEQEVIIHDNDLDY